MTRCKMGTPDLQEESARSGHQTYNRIARRAPRPTAGEMSSVSSFRAGVLLGFLAAALIALAVMWLWVVPTMDGAVAASKAAYAASAVAHA